MKFGFDLDGVLDKTKMRDLCNALYDAGHEIYVITGGLAETGEWAEFARLEKLKLLDVRYTKLIRCIHDDINQVGYQKGCACNDLKIDVFFDDSQLYLAKVAQISPVQKVRVL